MNIQSLIYKNKTINWNLELIAFKPLTLLVGASGVGKTQILMAIINLQNISRGNFLTGLLSGLEWKIKFLTQKGTSCEWQGSFESKDFLQEIMFDSKIKEDNLPTIEYEKLFIAGKNVINRTKEGILFNEKETVKLSPTESVIYLLKEEKQVKEIHQEFEKVLFSSGKYGRFSQSLFLLC